MPFSVSTGLVVHVRGLTGSRKALCESRLGYLYAKQKHLGAKKCKANQKQQLSDYKYIAILATKSFDIRPRPRIN